MLAALNDGATHDEDDVLTQSLQKKKGKNIITIKDDDPSESVLAAENDSSKGKVRLPFRES